MKRQDVTIEHVASHMRKANNNAFPLLGTWILGAKITDNATTATSLLGAWDGSTGIADVVIREQLGQTGANPKYAIFGTALAIEFFSPAETASIVRQLRAAGYLRHAPGNDPQATQRFFKFGEFMDSPVQGVASGATAEITAITTAKVVEPRPCAPFLLDLERDVFTAGASYACNTAADVLLLVKVKGLLAPNSMLNKPAVDDAIEACCKAA